MESRICTHPDICNGRPVITGTRIPIQTILEFLEAGDSIEDVLEEYPSITREYIYASNDFFIFFGTENAKRISYPKEVRKTTRSRMSSIPSLYN
ncbi:MAG: DUF433 domain-containing protein [Candidatus Riflebacteria bacterium]|nr:DUF433 domain-containing protein [Candidatus Riflebacteria bacterium]